MAKPELISSNDIKKEESSDVIDLGKAIFENCVLVPTLRLWF